MRKILDPFVDFGARFLYCEVSEIDTLGWSTEMLFHFRLELLRQLIVSLNIQLIGRFQSKISISLPLKFIFDNKKIV